MLRISALLIVGISLLIVNCGPVQEKAASKTKKPDEYAIAVEKYWKLIAARKYRDAYDMLSQCRIMLYSADSSGASFGPRPDYEAWLPGQKNIDSLVVLQVSRFQPADSLAYTADNGDAEATIGIRMYEIKFNLKLIKEEPARRSGIQELFVAVVKGTDDKIRILGLGTGP